MCCYNNNLIQSNKQTSNSAVIDPGDCFIRVFSKHLSVDQCHATYAQDVIHHQLLMVVQHLFAICKPYGTYIETFTSPKPWLPCLLKV